MVIPMKLEDAIQILRDHQAELAARGVAHAAVFGSTARGDATPESDVDILVELDPEAKVDLFAYAGLVRHLRTLVPRADVVDRGGVHPRMRDSILREAKDAF